MENWNVVTNSGLHGICWWHRYFPAETNNKCVCICNAFQPTHQWRLQKGSKFFPVIHKSLWKVLKFIDWVYIGKQAKESSRMREKFVKAHWKLGSFPLLTRRFEQQLNSYFIYDSFPSDIDEESQKRQMERIKIFIFLLSAQLRLFIGRNKEIEIEKVSF